MNVTPIVLATTTLELVATDGGNGITYDHAVWRDPLVECGGG